MAKLGLEFHPSKPNVLLCTIILLLLADKLDQRLGCDAKPEPEPVPVINTTSTPTNNTLLQFVKCHFDVNATNYTTEQRCQQFFNDVKNIFKKMVEISSYIPVCHLILAFPVLSLVISWLITKDIRRTLHIWSEIVYCTLNLMFIIYCALSCLILIGSVLIIYGIWTYLACTTFPCILLIGLVGFTFYSVLIFIVYCIQLTLFITVLIISCCWIPAKLTGREFTNLRYELDQLRILVKRIIAETKFLISATLTQLRY